MDFFEVIKERRSCREFKEKEIEKEIIQQILETAISAPSAGNLQAYKIFVVKDFQKKKKLAEASLNQEFICSAGIVLVFCSSPRDSSIKYGERGKLYSLQDATIAAAYAQLSATALGLSSCWIGAFNEREVLKVIGAKDLVPVCVMPIGYPNEKPEAINRKKFSEIVQET
jgi:nitroreductase